ncbi:hypothetical protein [Actinoplanes subtropicus]|uniref:hypothetical protein n=1 Tax=Actinoplanes subtropicus TaxID=543632 RepID=UPI0004C2F725|nr:hypothetical protein [Actinoplanes subtropicus]
MSSIVSFYIVSRGDLPAIVGAAGSARAWEAIEQFGVEIGEEFDWSGYVMLNVVARLEASGIVLASPSLREAAEAINADCDYITLIANDAQTFLDRLGPAAFGPSDLLEGPIDLGLDDEEAGYAITDALTVLRDGIARLSGDDVLLLHIGG